MKTLEQLCPYIETHENILSCYLINDLYEHKFFIVDLRAKTCSDITHTIFISLDNIIHETEELSLEIMKAVIERLERK